MRAASQSRNPSHNADSAVHSNPLILSIQDYV